MNLNLLVRLKIRGESRQRIRAVARIKIDAQGRLTLFEGRGGATETIPMADIESIAIHSTNRGEKAA